MRNAFYDGSIEVLSMIVYQKRFLLYIVVM
jgi:hypothetical protein